MKLPILAKNYPVRTYAVFCYVFGAIAFGVANLGSYDDGAIGFLGMLLVLIWSVIAFPISIPMDLLGPSMNGNILGAALGLPSFVIIEFVVNRLWRPHA